MSRTGEGCARIGRAGRLWNSSRPRCAWRIVRQQWQLVGERDRQPVEILGPAALEFEFDLAQRGLAIAGSNFPPGRSSSAC